MKDKKKDSPNKIKNSAVPVPDKFYPEEKSPYGEIKEFPQFPFRKEPLLKYEKGFADEIFSNFQLPIFNHLGRATIVVIKNHSDDSFNCMVVNIPSSLRSHLVQDIVPLAFMFTSAGQTVFVITEEEYVDEIKKVIEDNYSNWEYFEIVGGCRTAYMIKEGPKEQKPIDLVSDIILTAEDLGVIKGGKVVNKEEGEE